MSSGENPLVVNYLKRLRAALASLPEARRNEISEAVAQHIAEAQVELADDGEAAIRTMLDHLGEPEDIATEALEVEQTSAPDGSRHRDLRISRKVLAVGVAGVALCIGGIASGFALSAGSTPPLSGPTTTIAGSSRIVVVPEVVGLSETAAIEVLRAVGLQVRVRYVPARVRNPAGSSVSQSPPAGTRLREGSIVTVEVAPSSTPTIASSTTTTSIAP